MKINARQMTLSLMSLSLVLTSCGQPVSNAQTAIHAKQEERAVKKYSGEEILRGMLLGEGPAARHFADIWEHPDVKQALQNLNEEQKQTIHRQYELTLNQLTKGDPTYLNQFQGDMQSGDPERVEAALIGIGEKIKKLAPSGEGEEVPEVCNLTVCAAVVVTAVMVTHYAGIYIVLLVKVGVHTDYAITKGKGKHRSYDDGTIASDQYLAKLTKGLEASH